MSRIRYLAAVVGVFAGCLLLWPAAALGQLPPPDPKPAPPPPHHAGFHFGVLWTVLVVVMSIALIALGAVAARRGRRSLPEYASA